VFIGELLELFLNFLGVFFWIFSPGLNLTRDELMGNIRRRFVQIGKSGGVGGFNLLKSFVAGVNRENLDMQSACGKSVFY
jgi:hypothetical protein